MKVRIVGVMATIAVLASLLTGAPVSSVQAQIATQAQQATQLQIHKDCAKYAPRAVICLDKNIDLAYPLYKGKVVKAALKFDKRSRFGGWIRNSKGVREDHRTPNGTFPIIKFKADAHSNIYDVDMPNYIKFRDDGIGIHYSEDFDLRGRRISHGCVGLKSRPYSEWLFNWARKQRPLPLIVVAKN